MFPLVLLQRDPEASSHLRTLIDATSDFSVSGVAHTVADATRLIRSTRPEMLVTDLHLQDGHVLGLLSSLRKQQASRRLHVLVTLLSHDDAKLVKALQAGADGYWVHASSPQLLLSAMAQLMQGESPMTPMIARQLLAHFEGRRAGQAASWAAPDPLTATEQEVLERVAQGYLIDEIAEQSQASAHSLARSIRRVYRKLQRDSHAGLLSSV